MDTQSQTLVVVAIIAVAALILFWLFMQRRRTEMLRDKFGEEYDRTLEARGTRAEAEADLIERRERVRKFDIRPLGPEERERYTTEWHEAKALFVDSPNEAIGRSDRLLAEIMKVRGYPMTDFEHRHADLTVEHGDVARHYLAGHEIAVRAGSNDATTEELRQAIKHYEHLFEHLVNDTGDTVAARPVTAPAQG